MRLVPRGRSVGVVGIAAMAVLIAALSPVGAAPADDDNPWLERRVLAIAHAGGEDEAPHETMFAYEEAAEAGVDVLEADVRTSADGVTVVHHDADVDRTTDGTGLVADQTYEQLNALDHGYRFTEDQWSCEDCPAEDYIYRGVRTGDVAPPAGHTADDFAIPTLEALFERFPDKIIDIEIKESGERGRQAGKAVSDLIERFDRAGRTVVVSFDQAIVDAFAEVAPGVATSPGTEGVTEFFADRKPTGDQILQVPPTFGDVTVVTPDFVGDAHAAGMAVWVWMDSKSQENAEFYGELVDMGVDGLIASRPSVARAVIDEAGAAWDGSDGPAPDETPVPDEDAEDDTGPVGDGDNGPPGAVGEAPAAEPSPGAATFTG